MKCPRCNNRKYEESYLGNKFCSKPWCGSMFPIERVFMKNLYAKLAELRKTVSYLQKENKNQQQGFNYVSSSQVLGAVRDKMDELGLIIISEVVQATLHEPLEGKKQYMTELAMLFTWVDVETGDKLPVNWYAQGADMAEKGPGKAMTYAEKMFILKQLNIATDKEDPDAYEAKQERKKASSSSEGTSKTDVPGWKTLPNTMAQGMAQLKGVKFDGEPMSKKYKAFVEEMAKAKKAIGDSRYYECLKPFEKSIHVYHYADMKEIFRRVRAAEGSE